MTPLFAALPDIGYLLIVCVVIAVAALVGIAAILRFLRDMRAAIADELRREIAKAQETPTIAVQQPVEVTEHAGIASRIDLEKVRTEAHGRIKREREEINLSLAQLREEDTRLRAKLDEEIKELRQLMDDIPERTISLLAKTKGLL